MAEIRFTLGRVLEPKAGKFEVGQLSRIEEIDDLAAVHAVSSQTIRVPSNDALSLARFNPFHHLVELRASRFVRGFPFGDGVNDGQVLLMHELFQRLLLALDRQNLFVFATRGFAGVDEIFCICFHNGKLLKLITKKAYQIILARASINSKKASGVATLNIIDIRTAFGILSSRQERNYGLHQSNACSYCQSQSR